METEKPRILYIADGLSGGVFTYLLNLSRRLIDRYDIAVAYTSGPNTPQHVRSYFDERVSVYRLGGMTGGDIKNIVNDVKPQIVHLHGYRAGQVGRKALDGMKGISLYYTPHGYQFFSEDHNRLVRSVIRNNEASAAKSDAMTIACSKGEFAETLSFTKNATYVNNGIDTDRIDRIVKEVKNETHPFTVYTSGIINAQKNPGMFNEIAMAMPEVNFRWIGDGDLKYKLIAPNIEVTGWKDRDEALKLMTQSDVFILTSLWEGLPMALLEAMYLRKFSIVSNVVGSRDVIENGYNGYICDTAAAFVNAINHAKDPESQEIIENAYQDILENYTLEQMANGYDEIYTAKLSK